MAACYGARMNRTSLVAVALGVMLAACSSGAATRGVSDARVRSFVGQAPPELAADARWLNAPPSTLAGLRGRVVFLQFAFPT
jgi:hypothetical protein